MRPMRRAVLLGMGAVGIGGLLPHASKLAIADSKTEPATLFEEDPDNSTGGRLVGAVLWRVEKIALPYEKPVETVVKAEVDIPERQMAMTWLLRRNLDRTLPASHLVEFVFTPPSGDRDHDIHKVSAIEMKASEHARGTPLAGLTVKVTTQFFLMGLSDRGEDVERNVRMLKEQPWLALPIVYDNNRRATLTFAKGDSGTRAIEAAFAAWENPSPSREDDRVIDRPQLDVIK
jgi:hypothetical protein